tara:strand:+ start:1561 stop:1716 length:156 start_codon:yes stop_codon:yes gene_type:complete
MRDTKSNYQRISTKAKDPLIKPCNSKSRQPKLLSPSIPIKIQKKKIIISFD